MLCKDHWVDMSWDGLPIRQRKENLLVKFNKKASNLISFEQACDQVAQEIYSQHKNLYLGLSGGSDSENVANVLVRNKIPFTPVIVDYNHLESQKYVYESWYARYWCKQHNIEPFVVKSKEYVNSPKDKERFIQLKPRLIGGPVTSGMLLDAIEKQGGKLLTGFQLEYYPDHEQMEYLRPQVQDYKGFVLEESDLYIEALVPDQHPWAFHYWSPEIMAAFVNEWDVTLTMQENKAAIYKTSPRPKFLYPDMFFGPETKREPFIKNFGTLDCALLGTKELLLKKLVK